MPIWTLGSVTLPDKLNLRSNLENLFNPNRNTNVQPAAAPASTGQSNAAPAPAAAAPAPPAAAIQQTNASYSSFLDTANDLTLTHIATEKSVAFPAFLTSWNDTFSQEWNSTTLVGRMDSIQTYKRTGRKISFGWDVVSSDITTAKANFEKTKKLMSFSYPVFEQIDYRSYAAVPSSAASAAPSPALSQSAPAAAVSREQSTIARTVGIMSTPPIFKINFPGWAKDLHGTIDSLTFAPKFDSNDTGFYYEHGEGYIPKKLSFNCNITVIHTNPLGFANNKSVRTTGGLYGA